MQEDGDESNMNNEDLNSSFSSNSTTSSNRNLNSKSPNSINSNSNTNSLAPNLRYFIQTNIKIYQLKFKLIQINPVHNLLFHYITPYDLFINLLFVYVVFYRKKN